MIMKKHSNGRNGKKIRDYKDYSEACIDCPATCCKDLAVQIGKPENRAEIDDLKWQLHFNTVRVYVKNRRWYQLVEGKCIYLDENDLCTIYDRRPERCRRHTPPHCEEFADEHYWDILFETPEELEAYFEEERERRKRRRKRAARKLK